MIDGVVTTIKWIALCVGAVPVAAYLWLVYRHFLMKRKAEEMDYH